MRGEAGESACGDLASSKIKNAKNAKKKKKKRKAPQQHIHINTNGDPQTLRQLQQDAEVFDFNACVYVCGGREGDNGRTGVLTCRADVLHCKGGGARVGTPEHKKRAFVFCESPRATFFFQTKKKTGLQSHA